MAQAVRFQVSTASRRPKPTATGRRLDDALAIVAEQGLLGGGRTLTVPSAGMNGINHNLLSTIMKQARWEGQRQRRVLVPSDKVQPQPAAGRVHRLEAGDD